jgi:lambda family phage portal protein
MGVRSAIRELFNREDVTPTQAPRRRMFEGARVSRLTADWVTSGTSADAEVRASLTALRNRARQLVRDSDFARQALRTIASNVVGNGIPFQAQVKKQRGNKLDQPTNDAIEAAWATWSKAKHCHTAGKLCFADIERLVVRSIAESGEVLVRMVKQPFGGSKIPLALEVIEADKLDETYNGTAPNSKNEVRMGVELDSWQRPVAYWFRNKHPGDYTFPAATVDTAQQRTRISADEILHLFLTERPGQTRGISWFASAVKSLHHLAGYTEAEVIRARASSALMGFITSPEGELIGDDVMDGERVTSFEPGVFKYLQAGETVTVPNLDAPDGQFEPFVRGMLRAVSAGLGVSFESISHDFSQTNYSSSRLSLLEERDNWRMLQRWLTENLHQRVFEQWLELAVLSGALNLPVYEADPERFRQVRWMYRGWAYVDPQKEIAAYKEAEMAGYTTKAEIIAQNGGDIEEIFRQRRRELDLADELGLSFDTSNQPEAETETVDNIKEELQTEM